MIKVLLIGIGGAIGSIARYLIGVYISKIFLSTFPLGTFIVNFLGCLLIGIFFGLAERYNMAPEWRIFLTAGICGGFTTFSAFAFENLRLLQDQKYYTFTAYSLGSLVLGIVAIFVGLIVVKYL